MQVGYDAIVLAAGKNTRLRGTVPSYYKPLVLVNGRPLIVNWVANLSKLDVRHVIVVVSPENAGPITDVLNANGLLTPNVSLIVQPEARGPGEAVLRGLRAVQAERVLLCLGDNVVANGEIVNALKTDAGSDDKEVTLGTFVTTDAERAERFTRVVRRHGVDRFIENEPGGADGSGMFDCWVGPMAFSSNTAAWALATAHLKLPLDQELKISLPFNQVVGLRVRTFESNAVDIGTPEALTELES